MSFQFHASFAACAIAATVASSCQDRRRAADQLDMVGTELSVLRADGVKVRGDRLVGSTLMVAGPDGGAAELRIDKVRPDSDDVSGDIFLYTFSSRNSKTGQWEPTCDVDNDGRQEGFLLSGSWSDRGEHRRDGQLFLTCTSGAIGKCVRFGYKPWKPSPDGSSLWDYHQACTRMVRADYCGDGGAHTRDGTLIDVFDKLGIQKEESQGRELSFEAGWGPNGATCLAKARLSSSADAEAVAEIAAKCPEKLADSSKKPKACTREAEQANPAALLFNKS